MAGSARLRTTRDVARLRAIRAERVVMADPDYARAARIAWEAGRAEAQLLRARHLMAYEGGPDASPWVNFHDALALYHNALALLVGAVRVKLAARTTDAPPWVGDAAVHVAGARYLAGGAGAGAWPHVGSYEPRVELSPDALAALAWAAGVGPRPVVADSAAYAAGLAQLYRERALVGGRATPRGRRILQCLGALTE
jgi:hypothetical protein